MHDVVPVEIDPLGGLPSLICLTRLDAAGTGSASFPKRDDLAAALRIDPILTLRALRMCQAPILGDENLEQITTTAIVARLGHGALARMVGAPAPSVGEIPPLFRLWLHALASAVAARSLAELDQVAAGVDPEEAFTSALLHDVPLWGYFASHVHGAARCPWGPLEWCKAWNLPEKVQVAWLATHCGTAATNAHQGMVKTVVSAEAVAILAGYGHPGQTSPVEAELVRMIAGQDLAMLVDRVRKGVHEAIDNAGLEVGQLEQPPHPETILIRRTAPLPPFEEGIVKLQELGDSELYRPVLTSLVAGMCRYLGYDRSFFVQWVGKGAQRVLIRTKYDRTAVPVGGRMVVPSPVETALMGRVAGCGKPEQLKRAENFRYRLLDHLASDAVLVVPVCGGSSIHGLLLLDRSYTSRQSVTPQEQTRALALAGVCGQTLTGLALKRTDLRSRKQAQIDSLTGLLNRRAALGQLDREIQRVRRREQPMAVLMLDLDHFKQTNDTYGHLTGDRVLARVGSVLKATVRGSDVAARYGGEEFLITQFDTTIEEASILAARIYRAVEEVGAELDIPLTISVGLTDLRPDDTVESLLVRADQALYASKDRGRNRFSVDSQ